MKQAILALQPEILIDMLKLPEGTKIHEACQQNFAIRYPGVLMIRIEHDSLRDIVPTVNKPTPIPTVLARYRQDFRSPNRLTGDQTTFVEFRETEMPA